MAISAWMPVLETKFGEVSGMTQVHPYDKLPAALGAFPCTVILPLSGNPLYSAGGPFKFVHEVQAAVYFASGLLPEAASIAIPFIHLVRNKLAANISLDGTVDHCLPSSNAPFYEGPGGVTYNQKTYMGIVFRLEVKEDEAGDFTVSA